MRPGSDHPDPRHIADLTTTLDWKKNARWRDSDRRFVANLEIIGSRQHFWAGSAH